MVPLPTWLSIPTAGATAAINTTGLNMSVLYVPNDLVPAQHLNYFLNGFSNNGNVSETAVSNVVSELLTILTAASISPDGGLTNQVKAALDVLYASVSSNALKAPLDSPTFTGTPTAPTKNPLTNNTAIATTAYVDLAVGVETTRAEAAESSLQPNLNFILDYRNTSGSTTRTETVNNLAVGQTAEILWNLSASSGGTGSMTIALPSTGTYVVAIFSIGGTGSNRMVNGSALMYASIGTVAGGTTFSLNTAAPTTTFTLTGKVYRVS